ncbi:MAG TPA: glycosyltransferase family 2 protein [Thermoanaerobaculia bacterium]|nr:glycosyltransferase family 2 protein [Thermoanaerobaculia bacterium]
MARKKRPTLDALAAAPGRLPVSVIITTFNEEINVEDCIDSVAWADEILLVDSYSTDRTVELAKARGVKVLEREYYGSAAQKNWSIDKVSNDWILIIDADERVPEPLAREILALLATGPRQRGYSIRRQNVFLDKVIRHSGWSTDKVIRLFDRHFGRYPNRRVHADLEIEGPTPILKNPFVHYTCRSLDQYLVKLENYALWGAAQAFRDGRKAGISEIFFRPIWRFIRMYVLQAGFLDGMHGLVLCTLQGYGTFLKYARLWEYQIKDERGEEIDLPAFDEDDRTWQLPAEQKT